MKSTLTLDAGGVVISSLCIVHCLLLPILGTVLPILGVWSENEWIHKTLLLIALPLCAGLVLKANTQRIRLPAMIGLSLLFMGAFVKPLHEFEVMLTVIGAIFLAAAHLQNIRKTRHPH